jgi:NTP pyrophosphatase (non-canonical NTP hydrolase)
MANANQTELIDTQEAQKYQIEYDEKYFEINRDFEKLRHVLLHLMKTVGKAATYVEVKEHGRKEPDPAVLINEVAPDLLMHALQLANLLNIDLGEAYQKRIDSNIARIEAR